MGEYRRFASSQSVKLGDGTENLLDNEDMEEDKDDVEDGVDNFTEAQEPTDQ